MTLCHTDLQGLRPSSKYRLNFIDIPTRNNISHYLNEKTPQPCTQKCSGKSIHSYDKLFLSPAKDAKIRTIFSLLLKSQYKN